MSLWTPLSLGSVLRRSLTGHAAFSASAVAGPSRRCASAVIPASARRFLSSSPVSRQPVVPRRPATGATLGLPSKAPASPRISSIPTAPQGGSSIFAQVFRRAFSSSRPGLLRQTYFPKKGGYGGRQPPPGGWFSNLRRRIDRLSPTAVVYTLIALNVVVFLLWQYGLQSWQRFRDPSLHNFLTKNFVLNEANIMAGRVWTLLTACFSHSSGTHIFVNCLSLYFVAPAVASLIGSSAFLGLYLGGGIIASGISLAWHRFRGDKWAGSEGASGAIYACLGFYGAIFPNTTFLLFFVLPMPAWVLIGGMFAYDGYSAFFRPGSGTDSAGHVGGIMAGLGAALFARRRGMGGGIGRFGRF
ncbi:uncharacterized protein MKK02DRAFT_31543 [Dioszegia hungarica]|uniref:Peptidase S54 rhomboid domain-containing protein n=1 Tax=Dioszegia hungarica TaxID=4972 RepID=A0AA38HER1_9TREE|nr:uncharacterized protein MKK02DRAFT_31543 [Dioszegia hungarica]KAI9638029.1 hypothetical protein MKK02DRAFT_31543 [Dioszegia hungarica]